jgi:hypothetical protein
MRAYLGPFVEPARSPTFAFSRQWMREQAARVSRPDREGMGTAMQINLPPSYLLIHRVWVGGIGVLSQLEATAPFRDVLADSLPGFADCDQARPEVPGRRSGCHDRVVVAAASSRWCCPSDPPRYVLDAVRLDASENPGEVEAGLVGRPLRPTSEALGADELAGPPLVMRLLEALETVCSSEFFVHEIHGDAPGGAGGQHGCGFPSVGGQAA